MSVIEPDENELGDGLNDLEQRRHSAGVQRGMRVATERGFYKSSRAPYGYREILVSDRGTTSPKFEPDPQTVGTVRIIFDTRLQGATQREIAQRLNGSGIPSPTKHQWDIAQVRIILRNEAYCGTMVRRRVMSDPTTAVRVPNGFPAIISQEDFDKVQRMK